ncbi:MAG: M61 family metallopeptidase [Holophagaceae bacterium]|nr:M61 family metallopeptidase [Holophagaceae bacterium]
MRRLLFGLSFSVALVAQSPNAAPSPIAIALDATDATRHILHAKLSIPAKPGPLTLLYPKWIPGEHGPTGPAADLVNLRFTANGKILAWRRDLVDMNALHLDVPQGASDVEASLDFISPTSATGFSSGASVTDKLAMLSWNQVLLYPKGAQSDSITYHASLKLPAGWNFGTALESAGNAGGTVTFKPVSLTTLVDSPVLAGANFRKVDLGTSMGRAHFLDLAADSAEALAMTPETTQHFKNLVAESGVLFGARHYAHYDFLYTLSDNVAHFGLEHHESSDDRTAERSLIDPQLLKTTSGLLPHEMVHSWNGKYRRPAGLATGNFDAPMKGDLLWVYEGLTTYLGSILTARSGLWTAQDYRDDLAILSAALDRSPGRSWRPLQDTCDGAQMLYGAAEAGSSLRRSVDFYPEGQLIWLEVDTSIRELTKNQKSLDDFCRAFYGAPSGAPTLKTYTFEDVVATLNQVAPHGWAAFLRSRLDSLDVRAPLGGVERSGWKLTFADEPTDYWKDREQAEKYLDVSHSVGLLLSIEGMVSEALPASPAANAGLIPGMKLLAVNGRKWSGEGLHQAIKDSKSSTAPMEFITENGSFVKVFKVDYHGGERYPRLTRIEGTQDRLTEILAAQSH